MKLKKLDAIILVSLIVIAGGVLYTIGLFPSAPEETGPSINFEKDEKNNKLIVTYVSTVVRWSDLIIDGNCNTSGLSTYVVEGDEITDCNGEITIIYRPTERVIDSWTFVRKDVLPENFPIDPRYPRGIVPNDEGSHFDDLLSLVKREWWYYTAVFDKNSELAGWSITISFNHMAYGDLLLTKPDMMVVTLHGPDGEEFGGFVNRPRLLGTTLKVKSSNSEVIIDFEDSWVQGIYPEWVVHVEGEDIDKNNDIMMHLTFTAPSLAIWTHNNRPIQESKSQIASYIFTSCEVKGTVMINGKEHSVSGVGSYDHSWSTSLLKQIIKGWDWCHITLENGWNIYYSNYYLTSQITTSNTYKFDKFSTVIITTDKGKTITPLEDVEITIENSERINLLLKRPSEITLKAQPSSAQPLLATYGINLELSIKFDDAIEEKFGIAILEPVGMDVGRSTITGRVTWSDDDGDHDISLNGIGSMWTMRH